MQNQGRIPTSYEREALEKEFNKVKRQLRFTIAMFSFLFLLVCGAYTVIAIIEPQSIPTLIFWGPFILVGGSNLAGMILLIKKYRQKYSKDIQTIIINIPGVYQIKTMTKIKESFLDDIPLIVPSSLKGYLAVGQIHQCELGWMLNGESKNKEEENALLLSIDGTYFLDPHKDRMNKSQ